jgi:hypothetical protein
MRGRSYLCLKPVTSSVSGIIGSARHLHDRRSGPKSMYPPLTVRLRQGPPHRARGGHAHGSGVPVFRPNEFVRPACVDSIAHPPGGHDHSAIFRIMDFAGLVVRDGDLVTASGRLVRNQAGDWFEPPVWVAAVGGGLQVVRPVSPVAVRISGADFDELATRFEDGNGTVEGLAALTGIWSAGYLHVRHQTVPGPIDARVPRWVTPPCPAPAGGWPRHGDNRRFDLNDLPHTGVVVAVTVFRPGQDQEVLVVAAMDAARGRGLAQAAIR